LQSLLESVSAREKIETEQKKLESRKKSTETDLNNVTTGKKSVRTLFKDAGDTGGMVNRIESVKKIQILNSLTNLCLYRLKKKSNIWRFY
jgi:hypothetical protein